MKSKLVDTITSNEEHVRLKIFDGELPAEDGVNELLRIERAQHGATRRAVGCLNFGLSEMKKHRLDLLAENACLSAELGAFRDNLEALQRRAAEEKRTKKSIFRRLVGVFRTPRG